MGNISKQVKRPLQLKPLFIGRMKELLGNEQEFNKYIKAINQPGIKSIRCNTLKISPEELKKRLTNKGWKISQPFLNQGHPEVMIIENQLEPGEIGRSLEHLLGYYYVQEISSMLPVIILNPEQGETILDLCAAPGSKTTQASAMMKNTGLIVANEVKLDRIRILASNTNKCGCSNLIITKRDGISLCKNLSKVRPEIKFDKILIDAPCSGEGTLKSKPKTAQMWNIKTVKSLPRLQKALVYAALEILKPNGEILYSTCTHAPEENEEVINAIINTPELKSKIKIENISLPLKCAQGITCWQGNKFSKELAKTCRIYPHESNTEGFFLAKLKKVK